MNYACLCIRFDSLLLDIENDHNEWENLHRHCVLHKMYFYQNNCLLCIKSILDALGFMIWTLTYYQTFKEHIRCSPSFCTTLLKDKILKIVHCIVNRVWVQKYIKSLRQPCDCTEWVNYLLSYFAVKPLVELDPRPQLKPRLLAEPRLFMEHPAAVELAQHEDTQETGESLQHIVPVLPVNPQLMFQPIVQPIAQPIAQPQPVKPPSPKREPAYSDQVRSSNEFWGGENTYTFLWPLLTNGL